SFAVLHDVSLHPLLVALTVGRGDLVGFMRELGYAYGRKGVAEAKASFVSRYYHDQEFPIFHRVVDLSLGVMVHSQYAAEVVRSLRPQANLAVIPQGTSRVRVESREESRRRLGLDPQEFIVASLGFATPEKRLEPALRAFTRFHESRPGSRFLVVGEVPPWYDLAQAIERLGLKERVLTTGRVPLRDFYAYAAAADVCLGLRYPTHGETSAALLRIMALGRPVVVSRIGSLAELPPGTCLHVPVGDGEEDGILEALTCLAGDEDLRRRLGQQARAYVQRHHSWPQAARAYYQFIVDTLSSLW
ncbi:MAG: glycosyltransferase family 4 protein, partial [Dehalococcoidia bacterium]|nr:glycosyltransferase family 4 protein [Dehalococcoidia bacterium]